MIWSNVAVVVLVAVLKLTSVHADDGEFECFRCNADPLNEVTGCPEEATVHCEAETCISYRLRGNPGDLYRGCLDMEDSIQMLDDMSCNSTNPFISEVTCCFEHLCNESNDVPRHGISALIFFSALLVSICFRV